MKKKTKIFFDFDNTLVDTTKAFIDWYNHKMRTAIDSADIINYNFSPQLNLTKEQMLEGFTSKYLYKKLTPYPGVKEFLQRLVDSKLFEIYLITNCSSESIKRKIDWLCENDFDKYFDGKIYLDINSPYDKSTIDMRKSIFIDDHKENHLRSSAKWKLAFKDNPNRTWYPTQKDGVYVFSKWNNGIFYWLEYIAQHNN